MTRLSKDLLNRILVRLRFNELPVLDITTLRRLYTSWCMNVSFDNVRKMIVVKSEDKRPLHGIKFDYLFSYIFKMV